MFKVETSKVIPSLSPEMCLTWLLMTTLFCILGVNQQIVFSLKDDDDGIFKIDARTGLIQLAKQLDRETKSAHKITVIAADKVRLMPELVSYSWLIN